uniref:Zonadhesin-like n=1 Tax=Saccoglossus kowalevskii TaxID=10224 RepID=A0ABM0MR38_SACKO|nr:PREDICTED: zonadhesin-like [Saccoglossus kowalevskii]
MSDAGAVLSGDPHMTTFDGRRNSFQGACWYTFFKDCTTRPDFEVTIKFEKRDDIELFKTRTVSFKVTVRDQYAIVNGMDVVKGSTGDGHVDSTAIQIQEKDSVITLTFTAKDTTYTLTWTMRKHILEASFSGTDYNGKLCGLMGYADGNKHNDFKTPDGTSTNDSIHFGESWKVNEEV